MGRNSFFTGTLQQPTGRINSKVQIVEHKKNKITPPQYITLHTATLKRIKNWW
jgi:hypothetical protein